MSKGLSSESFSPQSKSAKMSRSCFLSTLQLKVSMFALRLEKFPIDYQLDHVVINDAAAVLCAIEHAVCTELVYQPGCPIGKTVNFIYRRIGEYFMIGAGVSQMPFDVLAYLSPV